MANLDFTTYAELKVSIAEELNRSDLTNQIPGFVRLLEAELDRHEATRFERSNEPLTLSASPTNLPTDCRELAAMWFDDGVRFGPIDIVSEERLPLYRVSYGLTGHPRAAAVIANGDSILLAPVPDQAYVVRINYLTGLDKLSIANPGSTSNWILADHPDIYFYGSLMHSAPYLKNDERLPVWEKEYNKGLAQLAAFITRRKFGANTLVMRPRRAIG